MSGVPLKILLDAVGTAITVELESGEQYHGRLDNVEDCLNLVLRDVDVVDKKGAKRKHAQCYVRGANIVLMQLPDALTQSPAITSFIQEVTLKTDNRAAGKKFGKGGDGGLGSAGGFGAGRKKTFGTKRSRDEPSNQ